MEMRFWKDEPFDTGSTAALTLYLNWKPTEARAKMSIDPGGLYTTALGLSKNLFIHRREVKILQQIPQKHKENFLWISYSRFVLSW